MTSNILKKLNWFILIMLVTSGFITGDPDKVVQLRLYEGAREPVKITPKVTTTAQLTPLFRGHIKLEQDHSEEKAEIKKIFNLSSLEKLSSALWVWEEGKPKSRFQLIVIGGQDFYIYLNPKTGTDGFQMEVMEKEQAKMKKIFESDFILPQNKSTIFGFEDSSGKPYFLAFDRYQDSKMSLKLAMPIRSKEKPKLLKLAKPVYPKEALRSKISGIVIMEATTDVYGKVQNVKVKEGHPVLNEAAVEAVKKWIYEPYLIDGKPKPVRFTVTVNFSLHKDEEPKQ